jgi:hypothetical protein
MPQSQPPCSCRSNSQKSWIDQLRWQRLKPREKLARMLLDHLEGILNYYRNQGAAGGGGGGKWKHQGSAAPRTWLSGSQLSAAESATVWQPPRSNSWFYKNLFKMRASSDSRAEIGIADEGALRHGLLKCCRMYGLTTVGEWLSLVEHLVRDQGVGGSNPLSPTISFQQFTIESRSKNANPW